jgi:multiple sugar transport system permease protein
MTVRRTAGYIVLCGAALVFLYPLLWMALLSLKPQDEAGTYAAWSGHFTLANYALVLHAIPIVRALGNSMLVATSTTVSVIVFSALTGYALARLTFPGRRAIFTVVLVAMALPFQLTLIPLYELIVRFGWSDTYWALIAPNAISALGILIFRQTFLTIPEELIEAARMEGASELAILTRVFLPISMPAVATAGILTFMNSWNDVLWPIIVIRKQDMMTLPQLVVAYSAGGQAEGLPGQQFAAAMFVVVPVLVAYLLFQRYFIASMASSGIKG